MDEVNMKDAFGKELAIGDKVFFAKHDCDKWVLAKGVIVELKSKIAMVREIGERKPHRIMQDKIGKVS